VANHIFVLVGLPDGKIEVNPSKSGDASMMAIRAKKEDGTYGNWMEIKQI